MSEIPAGAIRFNSDSQKLEYWNGSAWFQVHTATPDLASAGDVSVGARGVIGGGRRSSSRINEISAVQIQTTGNSLDFGDLANTARDHIAATSNGHGGL